MSERPVTKPPNPPGSDDERWEKEFGPPLSRSRKILSVAVLAIAFFGLLYAVFHAAHP